jgi:hypothetical protein
MNRKLTTLIATVLILFLPTWSLSDGTAEVRDWSGKLIEKRITRGNRTEVRNSTGKLIRVEIKKKDRVEIRTPNGRLLRNEGVER